VRYIDNQDGTITDTKTNLIWEKYGTKIYMTLDDALQYAFAKASTEAKEWRLPTIEELFSIIDYTKYDPAIDPIFDCKSSGYWSSSTYAYDPDRAWDVHFYNGLVGAYYKSHNYYVRCVRSGIKE
jgi:hypothetical protein